MLRKCLIMLVMTAYVGCATRPSESRDPLPVDEQIPKSGYVHVRLEASHTGRGGSFIWISDSQFLVASNSDCYFVNEYIGSDTVDVLDCALHKDPASFPPINLPFNPNCKVSFIRYDENLQPGWLPFSCSNIFTMGCSKHLLTRLTGVYGLDSTNIDSICRTLESLWFDTEIHDGEVLEMEQLYVE